MIKIKHLILLTPVLFLVGILVYIFYYFGPPGIVVTVVNDSPNILKNIDISYTGGSILIDKLEPHTSFSSKRVNPDGESHLILKWVDKDGKENQNIINVYFEPDYRGTIRITIDPDGKVSWDNHIWFI